MKARTEEQEEAASVSRDLLANLLISVTVCGLCVLRALVEGE